MEIPTIQDYQELYEEFMVHCEFFENQREPLAKEICDKIDKFYNQYSEFLNRVWDYGISHGQWLLYVKTSPYHSNDISRQAKMIYLACEDGLKHKLYHEGDIDLIRLREAIEDRDRFGF
jgi:hypothetical protein